MTALTKEEVINTLAAALEKQSGAPVSIEQSGSWYKIDGGKSVRFSALETMLAELSDDSKAVTETSKEEKPAAPKKAVAKKASKPVAKQTASANGGLSPKELWRQKLAKAAGKQTLPRGF